jgi:hypothetical protein
MSFGFTAAGTVALVTGGLAFLAWWLAKHTPRIPVGLGGGVVPTTSVALATPAPAAPALPVAPLPTPAA